MLHIKRMRQRASVFIALLVVVAVTTGLLVGIVGLLGAAESSGVRSQLAQRTGTDVVLQLSLASDPDGAEQDARVDALLTRIFRDGDRPLRVSVTQTIVSKNPVQLSIGVKAFVASVPDLEANATLVDGTWPRSPGEATVQADAAEALGLSAGDELIAGDTTLTITGIWRVTDPLDPRWVSDPLFLEGHSGVVLGPVVVAENELPLVGAATNTRWAVVPQAATMRAGDLDIFIQEWRTIADSMRADRGFDVSGLDLGGRFATVAAGIQSTVSALGAIAPVSLLVIFAVAVMAMVELGRLLATLRGTEAELFWSRGETALALARATAGEAGAVSLLGVVLGAVIGSLVVGQSFDVLGPAAWLIPAAVAIVATATFALTAFAAARSIERRADSEESGRVARITGIAVPVLLSVAAVISTGQLLLYGSPIAPTRDGGTAVDPIAVLAPVLCLLALVAIAVAIAPLTGGLLNRAAARSTRPALVLRTLARRSRLLAPPLVLCALAAGQVTIAATYAATWDASYTTATALRSGADLVLVDSRTPLTQSVLDDARGAKGVESVASVYSELVTVGATSATMVAATPAALALLSTDGGSTFDGTAAASQLALPLTGPIIPAGTRTVTVTTTSDSDAPVGLSLVIADELGTQREISAKGSNSFELPAAHGDWRVLAFVVTLPPEGPSAFAVTTLSADGRDVDIAGGWTAAGFSPLRAFVASEPSTAGFSDAAGLVTVRITPTFGTFTDDVEPTVIISTALADTARIGPGDKILITVDARSPAFLCVVGSVAPAIPGARSETAVLIDAAVVEAVRARFYIATPSPNVAWIGAAHPSATLTSLRDAVPAGVRVSGLADDGDRDILSSAATSLWWGAAGAAILSAIALMTTIATQLRLRRGEQGVLRALGVSDRQLAAGRQAELGVVVAAGMIVGVLSGAVVTVATIPALARAAIPFPFESLPTTIEIHALGLAIGLAASIVGYGLMLVVYGRRVAE